MLHHESVFGVTRCVDPTTKAHPKKQTLVIPVKRLTKKVMERGEKEFPPSINKEHPRPRTYGECDEYDFGSGPVRLGVDISCPFVSCVYHLYLNVDPNNGTLQINFPELDVDQIPATCALRISEKGGIGDMGAQTLEEVGGYMNLTRERVRQMEHDALKDPVLVNEVTRIVSLIESGDVDPASPIGGQESGSIMEDVGFFDGAGGIW